MPGSGDPVISGSQMRHAHADTLSESLSERFEDAKMNNTSEAFCDILRVVKDQDTKCSIAGQTPSLLPDDIRIVRQVCNGAREVLTFPSYHFKLNGDAEDPAQLPNKSFWDRNPLLSLQVTVISDSNTNPIGIKHINQIQSFIRAAETALRTITDIVLLNWQDRSEEHENGSRVDMLAVFCPLAESCPSLQQLTVEGDFGSALLAAFATSCSKLVSLWTVDVPIATLEQLPQLLPKITSTRMSLYAGEDGRELWMAPISDFMPSMVSCSNLTMLDIGDSFMTRKDWLALPMCLQELRCDRLIDAGSRNPAPPAGVKLPNLRRIVMLYNDHVPSLSFVADLLRAAPRLQDLEVPCIVVPCYVDQIPDLVFVNGIVGAGFKFTGGAGQHDEGLHLWFQQRGDAADIAAASLAFVASLPVLTHFKCLDLETTERSVLANMARAFPQSTMLSFSTVVRTSMFSSLAAFTCVTSIVFSILYGAQFNSKDLVNLCRQGPSLLSVEGFRISAAEETSFLSIVRSWGRKIEVQSFAMR